VNSDLFFRQTVFIFWRKSVFNTDPMNHRLLLLLFCVLGGGCCPLLSRAATPSLEVVQITTASDSIKGFRIGEVTVTGQKASSEVEAAVPHQRMEAADLQATPVNGLSDAVKYFSGVTVKDYGGSGGMKTLSLRSLGAQHTAISYDGLVLTDCQTGQTDLSRFTLDNVERIDLYLGDAGSLFQTARAFAASGLLTVRTPRPSFQGKERFHGRVGGQLASFGTGSLSLQGAYKLSRVFSASMNAEGLTSRGNYPYRIDNGTGQETLTRTNNRLQQLRVETLLLGHFGPSTEWECKAYAYASDRGLPGAVILYNGASSQRLWDRSFFVQSHYQTALGPSWKWQVNAKWNRTHQRYLNPDYLGSTGKEDYRYDQQEGYLSSTWWWQSEKAWSASVSTDAAIAGMACNLLDFAEPMRFSSLTHVAVKYEVQRLSLTAGALTSLYIERTAQGPSGKPVQACTPSLNASVQPFAAWDGFRLRAFWKSSLRVPSFNDLYYSAIGNTRLKPEKSRQLDLGAVWSGKSDRLGLSGSVAVDVFHNRIADKIQAIPTRNLFVWSMMNLGRVEITGMDLSTELNARTGAASTVSLMWNHSYQRALDMTDPASKVYGQQIAYAPRVYGSLRSQWTYGAWRLGGGWLYSGHRYVTGQNRPENDLPGYSDASLTVSRSLHVALGTLTLRLECLNASGSNYEVVRNFPMPGRSFRLGAQLEF
jgi:outer membrane cobalamin receptor